MLTNSAGPANWLHISRAYPIGVNLMRLLFQADVRQLISNWEECAGDILRRIQREVLHRPNDEEMSGLLEDLLEQPDIPERWRTPDLLGFNAPMVTLRARLADGTELGFLAMITEFSAPSNVTLQELQIESYLPIDEATRSFFAALT